MCKLEVFDNSIYRCRVKQAERLQVTAWATSALPRQILTRPPVVNHALMHQFAQLSCQIQDTT